MLSFVARRVASSAPRGARAVSTVKTSTTPVTSSSAAVQSKASMTTSAARPMSATSSRGHVVGRDGRVTSSHRVFLSNESESAAGLNEPISGAAARQAAKLMRMRDAKQLAGLV